MNKNYFLKSLLFALLTIPLTLLAQNGLENVIVEHYYVSDANDATDSDGGSLAVGSTTYRIYIDMAPGYVLKGVFGNSDNSMFINTTTEFFNNEDRGELFGFDIGDNRIDENTVALDSYLALGGVYEGFGAVLKTDDTDGSIIGGSNNDGGSEGIAGGLIVNSDASKCITPVTDADGMIPSSMYSTPSISPTFAAEMFESENSDVNFFTDSDLWFNAAGVSGPTADNMVLIAQITTDGILSFGLNVQLEAPNGDDEYVTYDTPGTPQPGIEVQEQSDKLLYSSDGTDNCVAAGCTDPIACNFDSTADVDDGTCLIPVDNCSECNAVGDALIPIDSDGDGICDAEEVPGCTDPSACNYQDFATDDNGTCNVPDPECEECVGDVFFPIDANGNEIPDCDEINGCTDANSCNYNETANIDDGSCDGGVSGCDTCSGATDGTGTIIDNPEIGDLCDDGDPNTENDEYVDCGVCQGTAILGGCTDPNACNYDETATVDDGSCLVPVPDCEECEGGEVVAIDLDGNGIGDCDEVLGCTDSSACNYNVEATQDDGTCVFVMASVISTTDMTDICAGDGAPDPINVSVSNGTGPNSAFVITDPQLTILDIVDGPTIDLEGAGVGVCLIWHLNFDANDINGAQIGANAADLTGCYALSNEITVTRFGGGCTNSEAANYDDEACYDDGSCVFDEIPGCTDPEACNYDPEATEDDESCIVVSAATIATTDATTICAGDGTGDPITVTVTGGQGPEMTFVITDDALNILDIVAGPTFDLEGAGTGTCLIWHLSFDANDISGAEVGANAADLSGCFALSNEITVVRNGGGCMDETAVNYDPDACFDDGSCEIAEILGCMDPMACNYDSEATEDDGSCMVPDPECETCENGLVVIIDENDNGVADCEEVIVEGCTDPTACNYDATATDEDGSCVIVQAASISTDDVTTICAGDGTADPITVTVNGGQGPDMAFVITDDALNILDIAAGPTFDLEGAGTGTCLIWHLSFDANDISGAEVGANAADLSGCYALSNQITVVRNGGGCTDPGFSNYDPEACFDDGSCNDSNCTTENFNSQVQGWQATSLFHTAGEDNFVEMLLSTHSVTPVSGGNEGVQTMGMYIDGRYFIGLNGHFHGDFTGPGYEANSDWGDWGTYISFLPASNLSEMYQLSGSGDEAVQGFRWIGFIDTNEDGIYQSGADRFLGALPESGFNMPNDATGRLYVGFADRLGQFENNLGSLILTSCNGTISEGAQDDQFAADKFSMNVSSNLELYPNPTDGRFVIRTDIAQNLIEVYDAKGKVVQRQNTLGTEFLPMDLSNQENGLYLIRLVSEDGSINSLRVLIQH